MRSVILPFLILFFAVVIQITLSSFDAQGLIVVLTVYVDDILLTGSDSAGIMETKMYLRRHFVTKDMGRLKYSLKIEIAHQNRSALWIFWRKQDFWNASLLIHQWKLM